MSDMDVYDESIKAAVEHEAKRRKRMLMLYLALLIVSMTIGGFAVMKAPTEATLVAAKIEPIVRDRVQASVAEGVTRDVVARSGPQIDERISSTFTTTVKPRLDEIVGKTSALGTSFDAIDQEVARIGSTVRSNAQFIETARPQLGQIAVLRATVDETTRSMNDTFAKRSELQERLQTERSARQAETQALITRERTGLRTEVRTLLANEQSRIREAILNDVRAQVRSELSSANERIRSLENRIQVLERRPVSPERRPSN